MTDRLTPGSLRGLRGKRRAELGAESPGDATRLAIEPIDTSLSFKHKAYAALKNVIVGMDVYQSREDIRLDERQLAQDFGVSRTPVREAMAQLEREGFVLSVPRRGVYVVRKTRREVIEMITAWAALESMAARLITENAIDPDIKSLRHMFSSFENGKVLAAMNSTRSGRGAGLSEGGAPGARLFSTTRRSFKCCPAKKSRPHNQMTIRAARE